MEAAPRGSGAAGPRRVGGPLRATSMVGITVAGVTGEEGKIVRGKYPLIQLETGGLEELDVVVATGRP